MPASRIKYNTNTRHQGILASTQKNMTDSQNSDLYIYPTSKGIARAADIIRNGSIVAFPTETVYGLGANALNVDAVLAIFEAKGRPLTDPLIVHVDSVSQGRSLVDISDEEAAVFQVLCKFWPGPLTIIAKAASVIPPQVTANTGFVGVRYPAHPLAQSLIRESGLPIAAPSANRFGHVSPTRAYHVRDDLGHKRVPILYGDDDVYQQQTCEHGIESSVVKINGSSREVLILRQGAVTQRAIESTLLSNEQVIGAKWTVRSIQRAVKMHASQANSVESAVGQEAPGQAITHYAPDVPCSIVHRLYDIAVDNAQENEDSNEWETIAVNETELATTIVIDFHGKLKSLQSRCLAYRDLSPAGSSHVAAQMLFDTLRWSESYANATHVFLPSVTESYQKFSMEGIFQVEDENDIILGLADRIFRAASGRIVNIRC